MTDNIFDCAKCAYYENTGCPEGEGFCVELECRMSGEDYICKKFLEVDKNENQRF